MPGSRPISQDPGAIDPGATNQRFLDYIYPAPQPDTTIRPESRRR